MEPFASNFHLILIVKHLAMFGNCTCSVPRKTRLQEANDDLSPEEYQT